MSTTTASFSALWRSPRLLATLTGTVGGTTALWSALTPSSPSSLEASSEKKTSSSPLPKKDQIEVDLMDKIAAKPYLNAGRSSNKRPSVPRRVRILAIDVPEMKQKAFVGGECRITPHIMFDHGTAPPKRLAKDKRNKATKENLEIMQKSLATALVKCRSIPSKRIGVELLEASVADLNPHNVRKTHSFAGYQFDPGKYSHHQRSSRTSMNSKEQEESSATTDETAPQEEATHPAPTEEDTTRRPSSSKNSKKDTVLATEEDELEAPWHQYAWIEELQKRVQGRVVFGEPMETASRWSRLVFGGVYQSTVSSQRTLWEWFLPPMFQRDAAGNDIGASLNKCWASQKPHAVIADGAAMQRVPGSLRLLQKTCRDANVPLFIIRDPRVWGGNTHQDLHEALVDMRKTIKENVVVSSMQGGTAFGRGRLLGQVETEAKWQAKDMGRRTRQAVRDAKEKLQRERDNDWSHLDESTLRDKLQERRVISKKSNARDSEKYTYTAGLVELARTCMASQDQESETAIVDDSTSGDATPQNTEGQPVGSAVPT